MARSITTIVTKANQVVFVNAGMANTDITSMEFSVDFGEGDNLKKALNIMRSIYEMKDQVIIQVVDGPPLPDRPYNYWQEREKLWGQTELSQMAGAWEWAVTGTGVLFADWSQVYWAVWSTVTGLRLDLMAEYEEV